MTGGLDANWNGNYLDSTEVYDPNVSRWTVAKAELPRPAFALSATNIDGRILIFGKFTMVSQVSGQVGLVDDARIFNFDKIACDFVV